MQTRPTQQQIDYYRENGFVAITGFLDAAELAEWRRCTEEAVEERMKSRNLHNQGNPDDYYAQVFTQCLRLLQTHAGMRKLMLDPRLGEAAAALAGVDGIRIWHDQALIKPPYGNPTSFHLDNPDLSFSRRDAISIWVALDDATLQNGCMYYLPGTHRTARYENVGIGSNLGGIFKVYPEWREIDAVPAPVPAGSAVFHNGLVAHGAGANMTRRPRRAMTCAYMPDGSTFNGTRNILSEDYFNSLKVGDILNNNQENPLVWRKAGA